MGVGHTRDRRRRLARGDVAHRGQAGGPGGEQVAEDPALGRHAADVDRRLGDDPQPTLAAQHHLAHARAGGGARHRSHGEHARRGDHPQPARELGDVAVAVGLHARGARRDPAAQRRVREAVGKVAAGPALGVELALEVGAEDAGLHARQLRRGVDRQHPVQAAHVDRDHGPRLLQARPARLPEMLDPPPNGITTASCSRAAATTAATSSSSAGRTTTSGSRPRSPRRWRIRSVRLLPRPVHDAVVVVGGDVLGSDGVLELGPQAGRERRPPGSPGPRRRWRWCPAGARRGRGRAR